MYIKCVQIVENTNLSDMHGVRHNYINVMVLFILISHSLTKSKLSSISQKYICD